jgi:hypothetical protein
MLLPLVIVFIIYAHIHTNTRIYTCTFALIYINHESYFVFFFLKDTINMAPSTIDFASAAVEDETAAGALHTDFTTVIQPWGKVSFAIFSRAALSTMAATKEVINPSQLFLPFFFFWVQVTANICGSKVDRVVQPHGEISHVVPSHATTDLSGEKIFILVTKLFRT